MRLGEEGGGAKRHDPRKNDLRTSGFAELPPGPAKLVRHQASRHSVSPPRILVSTCCFYFLFKFFISSSDNGKWLGLDKNNSTILIYIVN